MIRTGVSLPLKTAAVEKRCRRIGEIFELEAWGSRNLGLNLEQESGFEKKNGSDGEDPTRSRQLSCSCVWKELCSDELSCPSKFIGKDVVASSYLIIITIILFDLSLITTMV